jgi:hypothetical protein
MPQGSGRGPWRRCRNEENSSARGPGRRLPGRGERPGTGRGRGLVRPRSLGQRLYVPVYSSIHAMEDRQLDLAATVSVRNTDAEHSIRVEAMRYFGDLKQESGSTEPCLMGRTMGRFAKGQKGKPY